MFSMLVIGCFLPLLNANVCTKVQACSAQLSSFPTIEEDASGWGSGMVPIYDEMFETSQFDYTQIPDVKSFKLCQCANNVSCDASLDSRVAKLDETIQLTFCEDVEQQLQHKCTGRRGIIRVIGPAGDENGKSLSSVTSTLVFCGCPAGYQRLNVEPWGGDLLSIQYKCISL